MEAQQIPQQQFENQRLIPLEVVCYLGILLSAFAYCQAFKWNLAAIFMAASIGIVIAVFLHSAKNIQAVTANRGAFLFAAALMLSCAGFDKMNFERLLDADGLAFGWSANTWAWFSTVQFFAVQTFCINYILSRAAARAEAEEIAESVARAEEKSRAEERERAEAELTKRIQINRNAEIRKAEVDAWVKVKQAEQSAQTPANQAVKPEPIKRKYAGSFQITNGTSDGTNAGSSVWRGLSSAEKFRRLEELKTELGNGFNYTSAGQRLGISKTAVRNFLESSAPEQAAAAA